MTTITIPFVSPDKFAQLEAQLAANHDATVSMASATAGTIEGHGVSADFSYAPDAQILTVEVEKHPFYISVGAIEGNIKKALGQ